MRGWNAAARILGPTVLVTTTIAGCQAPTLADCIDSVDPELRELGLIPDEPDGLELSVEPNIRVMSVNVGNDNRSKRYALRLTYQAYEDHVAARIRELRPDIIGLQEVLPETWCFEDGEAWETNSARTCFEADGRAEPVRRLVGDDYSIVCDAIESVDCVAVHVDFGVVQGLASGEYEPQWAGTIPLPSEFETCSYLDRECKEKRPRCDEESSVMGLSVVTAAGDEVRIVHVHPAAIGQACREHQLADAFRDVREAKADDADLNLLILGDWNFDPDRLNRPVEETLYYSHVGPGRLLREHDERDENCGRVQTAPLETGAFDRVVTDFARGFCSTFHETHVPLGADEPLGRIDEDFDEWNVFPDGPDDDGRIDHASVVCDLYWPELDE